MSVENKYELMKEAAKVFRKEMNLLMKPRGFNIKLNCSKGRYWKDGSYSFTIDTPKWFEFCKDGRYWDKTEQAVKLNDTLKKRLLLILVDTTNTSEQYNWDYSNEVTTDEVEDDLDFNFEYRRS